MGHLTVFGDSIDQAEALVRRAREALVQPSVDASSALCESAALPGDVE